MKSFTALALLSLSVLQLVSSCAVFADDVKMTVPKRSTEDAVAAYYRGDVEKSVESLEGMLARNPRDAAARRELAWILRESGSFDKAIPHFEELVRLRPMDSKAERELFVTLCLAARFDRATAMLPLSFETSEAALYEAYLHLRMGRYEEAEDSLRYSLNMEEHRPMAWYALGRALAERDPERAEACYRTALRQDASLSFVFPHLADSLLAQGKTKEAYPLLLRTKNIMPGRSDIAEKIRQIEKDLPELPQKRAETAKAKKKRSEPPAVLPLGEDPRFTPLVRVGLGDALSSVSVKTGGEFAVSALGQDIAVQGRRGELLTMKRTAKGLSVYDENDEAILSSDGPITLRYAAPDATTLVFDLLTEAGSFYAVSEDRAYRGIMEFRPDDRGLTLVNVLDIEEYLAAVLPSEMPAGWPREALKAQAIAARSYTLASLDGFAAKGYDVHGSVLSAAYRGVGGESGRTTEAVTSTIGVILKAEGKPLRAYYSANHGGYSEDSVSVWGTENHMKAVPDGLVGPREAPLPLDELDAWLEDEPEAYSATPSYYSVSSYRWEKWVSAKEIEERVRRDKDIGNLLAVIPRGRGISGRVEAVEMVGTRGTLKLTGDRVRARLGGLRSTLFTMKPLLGPDGRPEYYIFTGGGWGHGVGLDQSGAAGMAAAGFSAEKILEWYYPRAEIGVYGM